jgi:hypothetical protein
MTRILATLLFALVLQPAAPQAGPWKSLFDGKSLDAWRIFKTDRRRMCDPRRRRRWEIKDGVLGGRQRQRPRVEGSSAFRARDQVEDRRQGEQRPFYRAVDERRDLQSAPGHSPQRQRGGNKKDNHVAGSVSPLYRRDAAKPANEWNQTRIVAKGRPRRALAERPRRWRADVGSPDCTAYDAASSRPTASEGAEGVSWRQGAIGHAGAAQHQDSQAQ